MGVCELDATSDLGGTFLRREGDIMCPDCGWERADADDRFPIVLTAGEELALISTPDDVVITGLPSAVIRKIEKLLREEWAARRGRWWRP
jgi:hypothetical protein